MSRLTRDRTAEPVSRDGTAEPVSRDQIFRRECGQGKNIFPCLADHVQDWQPYPVDPYSCYVYNHTYIHIHRTASDTLYMLLIPIVGVGKERRILIGPW